MKGERCNLISPFPSGYCKILSCPIVPSCLSFLGWYPSAPSQLVFWNTASPFVSPPRDMFLFGHPLRMRNVEEQKSSLRDNVCNVIDFGFLKRSQGC
ncbi:hypothetical protein TNIN_470061 [Trichonephila inaurata madagascariensis]|uniref:Uncharacterized protein n=1 Tax=Trichonephila inaurata madagascariensis TaxID=2747483 RepID=A0A8X6Y902_9ARAC|nr:hypothetical protein TNIN_470061 [Trichonephila inaurata madagascariensis]